MEEHVDEYKVNKYKNVFKQKSAQISQMDSGVFEQLNDILTSLDQQSDSKDFAQLIVFFQKGFGPQLIQSWSYFAQVNDHPKFANSTKQLVHLLRILSSNVSTIEYGSTVIKLILTSYTRVLYRGLNNTKVFLTAPTIDLMFQMISFHKLVYLDDFVTYFDLTLPSIIKILTPMKSDLSRKNENESKKSFILRGKFLRFWLYLLTNSSPLLRRSLMLDNQRIMGAWFKYMDKADSEEIIERTLDFFTDCLLKEPTYKKMTKTKILNELSLSKLHTFYSSTNKTIIKKTNELFVIYGSDPKYSVAFPDSIVWFEESPTKNNAEGVKITVNFKAFMVFNKLLFNMLRIFKPWEDEFQLTTVVKTLENVPELVPPYCHLLASQGTHDPKMTSYWFGCSLLLGRIIKLPIPQYMFSTQTNSYPSLSLVIENILPRTLTKSVFLKCFQSESLIFGQLVCQLLSFSFQKLKEVLKLYDSKGWHQARVTLLNYYFNMIPDLTALILYLNRVYENNKGNRILLLSITNILKFYSEFYPNFFSISLPNKNVYNDILERGSFKGVDLAILDGFFQFQEINGNQTKWWNATKNSNSMFTTLLKVASMSDSANAVSCKIVELLKILLHGSLIFNEYQASLIEALVNTCHKYFKEMSSNELTEILRLIDESISRCSRTPYKYVDMSHEYEDISPFITALLEQWKFIAAPTENQTKWLYLFFRNSIIVGESRRGIVAACESNYLKEDQKLFTQRYLSFENHELTLSNAIENESEYSSFFETIMQSKYRQLTKLNKIPLTNLDVVGILFRLSLLLKNNSIAYDSVFKNVVKSLFTKIVGFIMVSHSFNIQSDSKCQEIMSNLNNRDVGELEISKRLYLTSIILDAISVLKEKSNLFPDFSEQLLAIVQNISSSEMDLLNSIAASLIKFIPIENVEKILNAESISSGLGEAALSRLFNQDSYLLKFTTVMNVIKVSDASVYPKLTEFFSKEKIETFNADIFLNFVITNEVFLPLLDAYIRSKYFNFKDMRKYVNEPNFNKKMKILVALKLKKNPLNDNSDFIKSVIKMCIDNFSSEDTEYQDSALELLCECFQYVSLEQSKILQDYLLNDFVHKYTAFVVKFVLLSSDNENQTTEKWIHKLVLYITKYISERSEISHDFEKLLFETGQLFLSIPIWEFINTSFLNAQIEVIMSSSNINNVVLLNYATTLLITSKPFFTDAKKLLPILLNNDKNVLSKFDEDDEKLYVTALIIQLLFGLDVKNNSNRFIVEKLLTFYSGTISVHDKILFGVLEKIEAESTVSWTNYIYTWDFLKDYGEHDVDLIGDVRLITKQKEGIVLSLKKKMVKSTIDQYPLSRKSPPNIDLVNSNQALENFKIFYDSCDYSVASQVYDPQFLMLSIIHNKELVREKSTENGVTYQFDANKLLSSGFLQLIICALGDVSNCAKIASILLNEIVVSVETFSNLREGVAIKVLLKRIVFTVLAIEDQLDERITQPSPLIWYIVSRVCDILQQPSSPLFEKAYRWALNGHYIRSGELPLIHDLLVAQQKDPNYENYYKQLSWALETLEAGMKTPEDVELAKKTGLFEWLMNLVNSPYLNAKIVSTIHSIIYKTQRIDNGGSTLLTRYGALSHYELSLMSQNDSLVKQTALLNENSKNTNTLKSVLTVKEQKLNTQELLQGFVAIIKPQKRLREWVSDDQVNVIKRLNK